MAFVFAQVEDLFQQGLQCPRIAVDEFQSVARRFSDMRIQEQLFDWGCNQRERRLELVGDIGIEL